MLSTLKGGIMWKLFPMFICLFVLGCMKDKFPPQEFTLIGAVRLHNDVTKGAKIKFEVCRGTEWLNPEKNWNTTTDKWGNYKIIIPNDWFECYYRVKTSARDKHDKFYASEWEHGIVRFAEDRKDFWLGDLGEKGEIFEDKKKKRRRRR